MFRDRSNITQRGGVVNPKSGADENGPRLPCAAGHQNRPCVLRLLRPSICAAARIFPSGGPRSSPGNTEVRTSAENTKSAGGIASVSAFAFDGTRIERFGQSVKCQTVFFTFFTIRVGNGPEKFGRSRGPAAGESFLRLMLAPHLDVQQQAHQSPQRERGRQRHHGFEVLQQKGLCDLG